MDGGHGLPPATAAAVRELPAGGKGRTLDSSQLHPPAMNIVTKLKAVPRLSYLPLPCRAGRCTSLWSTSTHVNCCSTTVQPSSRSQFLQQEDNLPPPSPPAALLGNAVLHSPRAAWRAFQQVTGCTHPINEACHYLLRISFSSPTCMSFGTHLV